MGIWVVSLLLGSLLLWYFDVSIYLWGASLSLWFLSAFPLSVPVFWLGLGFCVLALFGAFIIYRPLRRRLITGPVFSKYKTPKPKVTAYELEALESGTVGWEAELFSGKPNWSKLNEAAEPTLSSEEKSFITHETQSLCNQIDDWKTIHEYNDLSPEVWKTIKEQGFFSFIIPKEYEGKAFSAYAHATIVSKISAVSVTAGTTVGVPNSLGPPELLMRYGTEAQKDRYLKKLAKGEEIPCFALTGPEVGSDASSIPDRGVICKEKWNGEETLGIKINFNKRYITLAPIATVIALAFQCYDPDKLLSEEVNRGITLALIPRKTPGITIGNRHFPSNVAFMNGPIIGEDVFIPLEYVIGEKDGIGNGWRMLMECLSIGRAITLPSISVGCSQLYTYATGAYAVVRRQFGLSIGKFEGVMDKLGEMVGYTYLMKATRDFTVAQIDKGQEPVIASAICKYHITELGRIVGTHAMDIHGGKGICLGPRNYLANGYHAIPVGITVEGANILTRNLIIFGQGAARCHRYSFRLLQSILSNDHKSFDKYFMRSTGQSISNAVRSFILSLTRGRFQFFSPPKGPLKRHYQRIGQYSASFAIVAETFMMLLGPALKRKESLSAKLGDILSYLYMLTSTYKRFERDGCPEADRPIVHWISKHYYYEIERTFDALIQNCPNKLWRWFLRVVALPCGVCSKKPLDKETHAIAKLVMSDNPTRDRLMESMQFSESPQFSLLDKAMKLSKAADGALLKLRVAIKQQVIFSDNLDDQLQEAVHKQVITQEEVTVIKQARESMLEIVAVDDFEGNPKSNHKNGSGNFLKEMFTSNEKS